MGVITVEGWFPRKEFDRPLMAGRRHPEPRGFIVGPSTPRVDRERPKHAQASDSLPAHNTHTTILPTVALQSTRHFLGWWGEISRTISCASYWFYIHIWGHNHILLYMILINTINRPNFQFDMKGLCLFIIASNNVWKIVSVEISKNLIGI